MKVEDFWSLINKEFYVGVPDSQLKELIDFLMKKYGIDKQHHLIGVNEGNCVALGIGYHLATGKIPVVYMQNSGLGNMLNPYASLAHSDIYGIPMIYVVGWRGEPGVKDEPQHAFQGKITTELLELLQIEYMILDSQTTTDELKLTMIKFEKILDKGKSVAFVIKKSTFDKKDSISYSNKYLLNREYVIGKILDKSGDDIVIGTTGKISREIFELREKKKESHGQDFLTVGGMGHASSIALAVALQKSDKKIWCIDGDGAALMHMGALAMTGAVAPHNFIHIIINNESHESVGGVSTISNYIDFKSIAQACGYEMTFSVDNKDELELVLNHINRIDKSTLIEVKCSIGSRADLGRPSNTPKDNKKELMEKLQT